MDSTVRSVRLLREEAEALEALALEREQSINGTIRIAVRKLTGLPVATTWDTPQPERISA